MPSPATVLPFLKPLFALAPIAGGAAVIAWRYTETRTPVSTPKIVIPPAGMATGFSMFLVPAMRVPWSWALVAFLLGALVLAWPLVRTSTLERQGEQIMMRRSNGFLLILLGLFALRLALHNYVGHLLSAEQTAALFFVVAFGMILRWRVGMYLRYRALRDQPTA